MLANDWYHSFFDDEYRRLIGADKKREHMCYNNCCPDGRCRPAGQREGNTVYFAAGGERALGEHEIRKEDDPRHRAAYKAQQVGALGSEDVREQG